jgi:hypothetical protein
MNKYSNGKIYMLKCNSTDKVYIGSTCSTLSTRLSKHLYNYKSFINNNNNFVTSFYILENDDYEIILIEDYPCETRKQLKDREQFYILNTCCVNKNIPNRTPKEWYNDNKDKIKNYYEINKERFKKYYQNNKETLIQNRRNYYRTNSDIIKQKKREYYLKNRDKIKERSKQYYLQHKK